MVRVSETEGLSGDARLFAQYFRELTNEKNVTQEQMAKKLGRARSYVNYRYLGYKSWTVNEIDTLAPLVECKNVFEVVQKVHRMIKDDEKKNTEDDVPASEVEDILKHVKQGDYTAAAWDEDEKMKEYYESEHDDD